MPPIKYVPAYQNESPYFYTKIIGRFLTYYVHRPVPPHEFDSTFTINDERYVRRPDNLAEDVYGDDNLWWVIPVRNGFQDPVFDLKMGTRLIIPHPAVVRALR